MTSIPMPSRRRNFDSRPLLMATSDVLERAFGPDPGLIRLRMACRAILAGAASLAVLLPATGGASHKAIAAIALAFMLGIISSVAVRDRERVQQALTFALLPPSALGAVALSSYLSSWPWAADLGFVIVATAVASTRTLGPRGTALGMVAFIGYFMGEIMHVPVRAMPLLALGIGVGLGASAFMRFLVLPEDPKATLRHVARHLRRRVSRVLSQSARMLAQRPAGAESQQRMHRELSRLNDTFQIADQQVESVGQTQEESALRDRILAVELAAERVLRLAGGAHAEDRKGNSARLNALAHDLRLGQRSVPRSGPAPAEAAERYRQAPLSAALDALEKALAALWQEAP